ncbi:hypothetical protein RO1_19710 [Roseburia intestinalis XB6B4]|uniref:Uncharacterized protein n=1 Tax=Roseburia intestinalis XB6B4 TaxID=718255 RepID=D4KYS5_9FIRM|nr:hypothetical protein RO1_19710 [Roseburia intestinalis XB6B4]
MEKMEKKPIYSGYDTEPEKKE